MTTLQLRKSISRSPLRLGFLLIPLAFAWLALSPAAQAVGPDTEGAIPGSNNGEGIGVLVSRTNGVWNTGTGFEALNHLTSGNQNTATGLRALFSDTNGGFNTATGVSALFSNTSGFFNNAVGAYALASNTEGDRNTAVGYAALWRNTADYNTATGFAGLYNNTTGVNNTANGISALYSNTTGFENTATGAWALQYNSASDNTANGAFALNWNTTGISNTANGAFALVSSTTGDDNTANGVAALFNTTSGSFNTANGFAALYFNTEGELNTAIGYQAGLGVATASNVICIGANVAGENVSNTCYIGNIFGVTSAGGTAVYINSDGKLGTLTSSARFKTEIKPMDKSSEAILALKPVTFRYKDELDPEGIPQFGLVAEEVEKVNPDLVARDAQGKVYTVRYEAVNAMLLNEFLKEHRKVEKLEATVAQQQKESQSIAAQQQKEIKALKAELKEQKALIQTVSDKVELNRPAPQMVKNNQR